MIALPRVFKNRNYRYLFLAGAASEFGSFITDTASLLHLYYLAEHSKSTLAISKACFILCLTLGNIVGGPIGEKFNKKNILIWCELIRIPALFLMGFTNSLPLFILSLGFIAFFTGIFNPVRQAYLNQIVAKTEMGEANANFGMAFAVLHLFGPMVGASGYAFFGKLWPILLFDFSTYLIGPYLLKKIREEKMLATETSRFNFLQELKEGMSYVKSRSDLICLFFNIAITGLCIGILIPLLLPFSKEVFQASDSQYGIMMAIFGVGGLLGGAVGKLLDRKFPTGKAIYFFATFESFLMLIFGLNSTYIVGLKILLIWGTIVFLRIPFQLNYLSRTVPAEFMSRTHSLFNISFFIPNLSGALVVAMIGEIFSAQSIVLNTSFVFILMMLLRLLLPSTKQFIKTDTRALQETGPS